MPASLLHPVAQISPEMRALLLEDREKMCRDDVSRTEVTEEELAAFHRAVVGQAEAERHVAGLRDPALERLLAANPPFEDAADVNRFFDLTETAAAGEGEVSDELAAALEMLEEHSAEVRAQGARVLGHMGAARAVDALIEALDDKDIGVRRTAAIRARDERGGADPEERAATVPHSIGRSTGAAP